MTGVLIAMLWLLGPAGGQIDGNEILKKVADQVDGLRDYEVTLDIMPNIENMSIPPMNVRMFFKKPDKVHIESKGFALLPREGLTFNPASLSERFLVDGARADTIDGKRILRLTMRPRSEQARTRRVILHVDPERWTAERFQTTGGDGRSMTADFTYGRVGEFWLPSRLHVGFSAAPADTVEVPSWEQQGPAGMSRPGIRRGTIDVRYSDYRVNPGLPDELFSKEVK